jgi:branched-chain amino acid aminotransferase
MNFSMQRMAMLSLDLEGFFACLNELVRMDEDWIPKGEGYSMYIRPLAIATSPFLGKFTSFHLRTRSLSWF